MQSSGIATIFDFATDGKAQAFVIKVYQSKVDDTWEEIRQQTGHLEENTGRLAFSFDKSLDGNMTISFQDESSTFNTNSNRNSQEELSLYSIHTTSRGGSCAINYGQDIPLILQMLTTEDSAGMRGISGNDTLLAPSEYALNADRLFMLTITFLEDRPTY